MMRSAVFLGLLFCTVLMTGRPVLAMPSPAAVYCAYLGYEYEIRQDRDGNQYGVCVFPDGSSAAAWEFFRGEAAQEHSYCARKGFDIVAKRIIQDGNPTICPMCVRPAGGAPADSVQEREIPMLELMERNSEPLFGNDSTYIRRR